MFATVRDISLGGVGLEAHLGLPEGSFVRVFVEIHGSTFSLLEGAGICRWKRPVGTGFLHGFQVKWTTEAIDHLKKIL